MKIDLRDALEVIRIKKEKRSAIVSHVEVDHIGICNRDFGGLTQYRKGEIVIYQNQESGLVVEKPMTAEQLANERLKGSGLTTICCIVGVPNSHIDKVLI